MLTKISRDEAHAAGRLFFYTGERCVRGHDTERYVSNGTCKACALRHRAPGPSVSAPNVRALTPQAFHSFAPMPTDDEVFAVGTIVQRSVNDILALVRALAATGLDYKQIAWLAIKNDPPLLQIVGTGVPLLQPPRLSAPAYTPPAIPTHVALVDSPPDAACRIDPLTGLSILKDADGNDQYRPNPYA